MTATFCEQSGYAVRVSSRARNVRLVVAPETGLTVVIPQGFDASRVPDIVARKGDWVRAHLERLRRMGLAEPPETVPPPERIELAALGLSLAVRYRPGAGRSVRASGGSADAPGVTVSGAIADRALVDAALRQWLKRRAQADLPAWLAQEAARLGLGFGKVSVRMQRARWGSCNAKGDISLNARLLFLPQNVAHYVLLHELAHLRHLNHSPDYWASLEKLLPGARALDRELRHARRHVPPWARG